MAIVLPYADSWRICECCDSCDTNLSHTSPADGMEPISPEELTRIINDVASRGGLVRAAAKSLVSGKYLAQVGVFVPARPLRADELHWLRRYLQLKDRRARIDAVDGGLQVYRADEPSCETVMADKAVTALREILGPARDRGARVYAVIHHHSGKFVREMLTDLICTGAVADLFVEAADAGIAPDHSARLTRTLDTLHEAASFDAVQKKEDGYSHGFAARCFGFKVPASFRSILLVCAEGEGRLPVKPWLPQDGVFDVLDRIKLLPATSPAWFNYGTYVWEPTEDGFSVKYGTDRKSPSVMVAGDLASLDPWVTMMRYVVAASGPSDRAPIDSVRSRP